MITFIGNFRANSREKIKMWRMPPEVGNGNRARTQTRATFMREQMLIGALETFSSVLQDPF